MDDTDLSEAARAALASPVVTMGAGPEPDDGEWLWLAVESAAAVLADKGPDEAVTVLSETLPVAKLAADDLEHRLAMVRTSGHPSALSLAAAIENFVASAGADKLSVIQVLYDWDGDHLHAFRVRRVMYSDPLFALEETCDEYAMRVPREPGTSYPFCARYGGDSPVEYPDYESDEEQQPEPFDLGAVNRRLAALGSGRL